MCLKCKILCQSRFSFKIELRTEVETLYTSIVQYTSYGGGGNNSFIIVYTHMHKTRSYYYINTWLYLVS